MKPYSFAYSRARSLEEALALLAEDEDARVLAGGQSLMPMLNMRLTRPSRLIDINGLGALAGIARDGDIVRVGALTRHAEVLASPVIAACVPLVAEAMAHVAHPAVRNRGTFGGSLCLADPAAELPAVCVTLDARLRLTSADGERTVAARDFFHGMFETALEPGEILTAIELPVAQEHERFAFAELARRHGDFAMAGLCVRAGIEDGLAASLDLGFFGVCPQPTLAGAAAGLLIGTACKSEERERAVAAISDDIAPQSDLQASAEMRLHLAGVLLRRLLGNIVDAETA